MRAHFDVQLEAVSDTLVEMTSRVGLAMEQATMALLRADLGLAESVIRTDAWLDHQQIELEERALLLCAQQQPVATDLRFILTSMKIAAELERMGKLARHIAKLVRLRAPAQVVPASLHATIAEMAQIAGRLVSKAGTAIACRDADLAGELDPDDDAMDRLHEHLFDVILSPTWPYGVQTAVDVTLCGRFYERFADHAVTVSRRVIFLVTGERVPGDVG
jgi:phosphate transport system protein